MCGIWACFHNGKEVPKNAGITLLQKRGPDNTSILLMKNIILAFSHLKINGNTTQPLHYGRWHVLCNGEIFNHKEIEKSLDVVPPEGVSDCWILPFLFEKQGWQSIYQTLDGEYAIIAYDSQDNKLYLFKDTYGIKPLFVGQTDNAIYVGSEMKSLVDCHTVDWVHPAGCVIIDSNLRISTMEFIRYVHPPCAMPYFQIKDTLRDLLVESVYKRCMSDQPIGALLSGGIDSSIICAILARNYPGKLHTFSVGIKGSPDLKYAKIVADHIGSIHHEILHTPDDFKNSLVDVIFDIESYDVTTVRASVGNWLVGKYIAKNTDIKVVFNGDGSDEMFGGYLYFHRAPSDNAFKTESNRLLRDIHMFDVLRSERCMSAHGLESRTPFLDPALTDFVKSIPIMHLRSPVIEKHLLRETCKGILPEEILNRRKEAFSDGVNAGEPWFKRDNEEEFYRQIFDTFYPERNIIPYKWMPKWSPETKDPSARTLSLYMNVGS